MVPNSITTIALIEESSKLKHRNIIQHSESGTFTADLIQTKTKCYLYDIRSLDTPLDTFQIIITVHIRTGSFYPI